MLGSIGKYSQSCDEYGHSFWLSSDEKNLGANFWPAKSVLQATSAEAQRKTKVFE